MLNVSTLSSSSDNLKSFNIELGRKEGCFFHGDIIRGRIQLRLTEGSIDVISLKITFMGLGKVNIKGKREETLQKNVVYLKKDCTIIGEPRAVYEQTTSYSFEDMVPEGAPSSVYSARGQIQYSIVAVLEYKNTEGVPSMVKAVRGITVVEDLELSRVAPSFCQPVSEFEQKNFGWLSCFGGQIRLSIKLDRRAFVCGEGMTVVGRVENKSDKLIDKVVASFCRVIRFDDDHSANTKAAPIDVQELHRDILAMYIEPGTSPKIDKKVHIPITVPSTPTAHTQRRDNKSDEQGSRFTLRRRSAVPGRLSISSQQRSSASSNIQMQRIMFVSYEFKVRVKSGGDDIIDITVPIIVGSKPQPWSEENIAVKNPKNNSNKNSDTPAYDICKHDRPIPLLDDKEQTLCSKEQIQYLNKYPFYPNLTTSSKQSKKLGSVADTIRTENKVMSRFYSKPDQRTSMSTASTSRGVANNESPSFVDSSKQTRYGNDSSQPKLLNVEDL